MIDKRSLSLENESREKDKSKDHDKEPIPLPDFLNFLVILDYSFPKNPPKILSKTTVYIFINRNIFIKNIKNYSLVFHL